MDPRTKWLVVLLLDWRRLCRLLDWRWLVPRARTKRIVRPRRRVMADNPLCAMQHRQCCPRPQRQQIFSLRDWDGTLAWTNMTPSSRQL